MKITSNIDPTVALGIGPISETYYKDSVILQLDCNIIHCTDVLCNSCPLEDICSTVETSDTRTIALLDKFFPDLKSTNPEYFV